MDPKAEETIRARQDETKKAIIDTLKNIPIIEYACKKAGSSRTTYYRFREEDKEFAKEADVAIKEGKARINDMAESSVIRGIEDRDKTLTMFWLNNNHPGYSKNYKQPQSKNEKKVTIVSWSDGQPVNEVKKDT